MPRLSLDAELDRLLQESQDATRYRDVAMVLRRLTLSRPVKEGARLTDETGRVWIAGEVGDDGVQPVATEIVGASASATAGLRLQGGGFDTELVAEVIVSAGGCWDCQCKTWRLDKNGERMPASRPVVVDLMESQIETARWAKERIAAFRLRRPHPQAVAELFSDRRAGKTFLGVLIVLLVAIDCPAVDGELPLVAWLVSVSHQAREELDRIIQAILPPDYYVFRELPKRMFRLANGSTILHKTTDDVESLRAGYVDVALLNESANMPFDAYRLVLRATQDRNGFLCLTTNTPKRSRGSWVTRVADGAAADIRDGREPAVKVLRPDPKKNAAVSQGAKGTIDRALRYGLEDENESLDEGLILESDAKCYSPPWDDAQHLRPLPQVGLVDVTGEITKRLHGRAYNYIIGADWQQQSASVAFKVFASGGDLANFTLYAVRDWFLSSGGDEDDVLDAIEASGLTAQECLTVGDASGAFQRGDHGYGPVSFVTLRRRGWEVVPPAEKKTATARFAKNPPVEACVGRFRELIQNGRFYVVTGEATTAVAKALRKCDATIDRYGNLRPKGIHAHLTDCCRYVGWWLRARSEVLGGQLPSYVTQARRR